MLSGVTSCGNLRAACMRYYFVSELRRLARTPLLIPPLITPSVSEITQLMDGRVSVGAARCRGQAVSRQLDGPRLPPTG